MNNTPLNSPQKLTVSFNYILLILWILIFASCNQELKEQRLENFSEIFFNIDSQLIGDKIKDEKTGIEFNPPKAWGKISDEIMQSIKSGINKPVLQKGYNYESLDIFSDTSGSLLIISLIEPAEEQSSEQLKIYCSLIESNYDSSEIYIAEFIKDDILFTQFIIQKDKLVNFKFLFLNKFNRIIQFDYIIPEQFYERNLKAVESSIGTINLI